MVEKVSDRARRRVAKPKNTQTIQRLRAREAVSQPDQPLADLARAEQSPRLNNKITYRPPSQQPKSKKVVQKLQNAPARARRFVGSHKKGSFATVAVLVLGVLIIVASTLVSGPSQFMQFTSLVKNTVQFMSDSITATRVMRDVIDIAQGESYTPGSTDSRDIGGFGRLVTDYYVKRLADRGIDFSGGSIITLRLEDRYRQSSFDSDKTIGRVSDEFKISRSAIRYYDNKTITIDTSLVTDNEYQGFLMSLEREVDNFATNELSATRRFLDTRRLGLETWMHTISRTDQQQLRKTMSHLEAWYTSRLAKMTNQELRDTTTGQFRDDLAAELKEILDVKMAKRVTNIDITGDTNPSTDDYMMLALAMACVDNKVVFSDGRMSQLYARVIMPSIIEALTLRSIDGQIHSIILNTNNTGLQDFTFDDLAGPTRDYFYDDIEISGGEKVAVNGWSGAPVKAALGYELSELDMARTVDYALRFMELRADNITGSNNLATNIVKTVNSLCENFFDFDGITEIISDYLGSEFGGEIVNWVKSNFDPEQIYWTPKNRAVGEYSLQTFSMDPSQKLTAAMYGSKYFEDYDNSLIGGRALDEDEVAELYQENQAQLAAEYDEKSVFDKLLDPSDYRSALSKLARDSRWDTTGTSPLSHLTNVAKTFAKIPQLAAASFNSLFRAGAASTNQPYDYGTQWYGYSADERRSLSRIGNDKSIFQNAASTYSLINSVGMPVNDASIDCFSTRVTGSGILGNRVLQVSGKKNILNPDGTYNTDYLAGIGMSYLDCRYTELSEDNLTTLRTYLLDYDLMAAGACFLATLYPEEEFDHDANPSTADIPYDQLLTPTCQVFM